MSEFVRAASNSDDVPEQHREAYSEMCNQFFYATLQAYRDRQNLLIMRELPAALQMNAVIVGAAIGALVPTLAMIGRKGDAEVAEALRQQIPKIVEEARRRADEIMKGR